MAIQAKSITATGATDRRMVLGLVSLAHAFAHMTAALMPMVYILVVSEFHVGFTEIGIMAGISSAVGGILQLPCGFAARFFSHKRLVGGGAFLLGAATVATGLAQNFLGFSLARWAAAIASAPQHPVGNSMISERFERLSRGRALAVHVAGGNAGTVVVPLLATALIAAVGWRNTTLLFSLLGLAVGAAILVVVRDRHALTAAEDDHEAAAGEGGTHQPMKAELRGLLANRNVVFIIVASMIAAGGRGLGTVLIFIPAYLSKDLGLGDGVFAPMYTVMLLGSVAGPLLFGRISDRLGRRSTTVFIYAGSAVLMAVLVATTGNAVYLSPVLLLVGLFTFSESPVLQTFLADSVARRSRDLAFGFYFALAFGFSALWVSLLGYLIDHAGAVPADHAGFATAFIAMAISYVIAGLLVLFTREHRLARLA